MSEYFIILADAPPRHDTLEEAQAAQRGLQAHFPEKTFTIHRCKSWLHGAQHFTKAVTLMGDIRLDGLTPKNRDRLTILLETIGTRSPKLKTLTRAAGPPEYSPPDRRRA